MTGTRGRGRWHEPMTWVQVIAVVAVVVAVAVVAIRPVASPASSGSAGPSPTMTVAAPTPSSGTPTASTTSSAAPASGPETCLAFADGVRQCTPGLTWNAHLCWAKSSAATLQMKTPSGAWTNVAVADVVTPSDYCSADFPVEVSIEYTETADGTYTYRFLNHATATAPGSPGDAFTVTVTTP